MVSVLFDRTCREISVPNGFDLGPTMFSQWRRVHKRVGAGILVMSREWFILVCSSHFQFIRQVSLHTTPKSFGKTKYFTVTIFSILHAYWSLIGLHARCTYHIRAMRPKHHSPIVIINAQQSVMDE